MLEKTLESPLDSKEIQPVHPKGDQSWIFIERTDAEAEALILWSPDWKSWLIGKDHDSRKDWGLEEEGVTEDKMVGWHHPLSEREFEQTPGDSEGLGSLACCSPWGHRVGHDWAMVIHENWVSFQKWSETGSVMSECPWTIQPIEFSRPEYWSG